MQASNHTTSGDNLFHIPEPEPDPFPEPDSLSDPEPLPEPETLPEPEPLPETDPLPDPGIPDPEPDSDPDPDPIKPASIQAQEGTGPVGRADPEPDSCSAPVGTLEVSIYHYLMKKICMSRKIYLAQPILLRG